MTLEEFREIIREHFGYLISDYGFVEESAQGGVGGMVVEYVSHKTRVIFEVSGWFSGIGINLTGVDPSKVRYGAYPLSDLLELRKVPIQTPQYGNAFSVEILIEEIRAYAQALREHASDILSGDHSIFPVLATRTAERLKRGNDRRSSEASSQ